MSSPRPLLFVVLVVATCGLVYELLAGTVASWVLGDSVTQFSTVIGAYLGALGLGAYLSGRMHTALARRFVQIELAVALVGGLATPALFLLVDRPGAFRAVLYGTTLACGVLVGLEVPLLLRVLGTREAFKSVVARVLTYDHAGSLLGSLLYSLLLAPRLGPLRTALVFGLLNALVALWSTSLLRAQIDGPVRGLRAGALAVLAVLLVALARSRAVIDAVESPGDAAAGLFAR